MLCWRRTGPLLAGAAVLLILLGLRTGTPAPFERLRLAGFDTLQRLSPRGPDDAPVLVVDVDEDTLLHHGQWPWPRTLVADLVRALQDLDASAVALDMVFAEPDRTSPSRLVPEWERRFGFRPADADTPLPDHDAVLAEVFGRGRVIAGFGLLPQANGATPAHLAAIAAIGGDPRRSVQRFAGTIANIAPLDQAASGHGSFTVSAGSDEIIRRLPLLMTAGESLVPSLALDALRVMQDEDTIKVRAEHSGEALTGYTVRVGEIDLPLDATGALWLHYPPARSTRSVAAWRLLDPTERETLRDLIRGKAVFVGTSATGLSDLRPTPMTPFEPGVNLHAIALAQALTHQHLIRPAWAPGLETLAAMALGLGVALCAAFAPAAVATAAAAALPPALAVAALVLFSNAGLLLDPTFPGLCVGSAFAASGIARYASTERAAQRLRSAFTHYLSPDLVAALASDPGRLKLGGESRDMTFLFTDLEGFTAMTESTGAEALVNLLNGYLDGMCSIAMEHGGTVDKIVGDAVHVMFNAPLDQPDHAGRAVACALALDTFAQDFKALQRAVGVPFGTTRIGVNTGRAVVGNFGGARRFDYTAHGDAINTAARLEAANKALGTRICVARSTCEQVPAQAFRPVGTLMLKGKSVGVDVFEPIAGSNAASIDYLDAFSRLIAGEDGAADALVRLHEADPDDPILALHARRIRAGARDALMAA